MHATTVICPQCGGPLPRQALWRSVTCPFCTALVTRSDEVVVQAARFHAAYARSQAASGAAGIECAGQRYVPLRQLGRGRTARLLLAERLGCAAERVVLKTGHAPASRARLQRELATLQALQATDSPGAAYFSQRLPQAIAFDPDGDGTLVLRHPAGYWGSLADVNRNYRCGIDARHAVWMWRRTLEVLGYVHAIGWAHGNVSPDHLLVHPGDHGIALIGWADALAPAQACPASIARDLVQSAWSIRALLWGGDGEPSISPSTPRPLAQLLTRASEDALWCARRGAQGIEQELTEAAQAAFGAPQFVHFTPTP